MELGRFDAVGSNHAFSPDSQILAIQTDDYVQLLSVPDFELIVTIPLPELEPEQRLLRSFWKTSQIQWTADSQSLIFVSDRINAMSRDGEIIGEYSLHEWVERPEGVSYALYATTTSVIIRLYDMFIVCDWMLVQCNASGENVGNSLFVLPDEGHIVTTALDDSSRLLVWQQSETGDYYQIEQIDFSRPLYSAQLSSNQDYILARSGQNGFTEFAIAIEYPSTAIQNDLEFDGGNDVRWLPDGEHFLTFDLVYQREQRIEFQLFRVGQSHAIDTLILTEEDRIDGFEYNTDFINIVDVSDNGERVLVSLGGTLLVVPLSYE